MTGHAPSVLVGLPSDWHMIGDMPYATAGEKYVTALKNVAQVTPIILPAIEDTEWTPEAIDNLLNPLAGVLFPGSASNIDPEHYDGGPAFDPASLCPARDALTLPLMRRAIERGIPLLAICRGMQELNVALGGSLHQNVAGLTVKPRLTPVSHQPDWNDSYEERYQPRHGVAVRPGGALADVTGDGPLQVNSLHNQAIDRIGKGLEIEALSADGLIEAVSLTGAPGFVLAVQWHPDFEPERTTHYAALFEAFGDSVRAFAEK